MKSVTEFANFTLNTALKTKAALAAEGKTAEEILESLGTTFKLEGDKLKHFMASLDVAAANPENLKRVLVQSAAEGETAPSKAVKVEEHYYMPEFHQTAKPASASVDAKGGKGGRGGGGKGRDGGGKGKESPWGMSPEEKAAKLNKGGAAKAGAGKPPVVIGGKPTPKA